MLGRSISAGTAEAPAIAVIGGGFAGSSLAYFLTRSGADLPPVLVFEPRGSLGGGLAYSTTDPSHRINVPAANMSLLPDDDGHFARWLAADAVAALDQTSTLADGRCFPARALFGRYVAEQLARPLADGRIVHRRTRVRTIEREAELYRISCSDGAEFFAQILVIATSHPPPSPPGNLSKAFAGRPKFIGNPWAEDTLGGIDSTDKVLIVGTGLTMADMVASLTAKGHHGPILAVSRRGQRSHGHPATKLEPAGDFINPPSTSALSLLRRIRQAVGEAAARGEGWQGVFDKLRAQGTEIWGALSHPERMRLVRHRAADRKRAGTQDRRGDAEDCRRPGHRRRARRRTDASGPALPPWPRGGRGIRRGDRHHRAGPRQHPRLPAVPRGARHSRIAATRSHQPGPSGGSA